MCLGGYRYEERTGLQHDKLAAESNKCFVFGGAWKKYQELYQVQLKATIFGVRHAFNVSIISGNDTPLLISRRQMADWNCVLNMKEGQVTCNVDGNVVEFLCPESRTGLMLLPILDSQAQACGLREGLCVHDVSIASK